MGILMGILMVFLWYSYGYPHTVTGDRKGGIPYQSTRNKERAAVPTNPLGESARGRSPPTHQPSAKGSSPYQSTAGNGQQLSAWGHV
jgi:hypothetical protein